MRRALRRLEHFPEKWAPVFRRKCDKSESSVFEVVVVNCGTGARTLRRRGPLQELRRMTLARFAGFARGSLGGIAADLGLQFHDVEKHVALAGPIVRHPRR